MKMEEPRTEFDALLERVHDIGQDPADPDRIAVALDCLRMFEDIAIKYRAMKTALKWYASERTWNQWCPDSFGDRARKALTEAK